MNCDVYNEYLLVTNICKLDLCNFLERKKVVLQTGAHFAVSVCDKSTIKFAKIHILPNWSLPISLKRSSAISRRNFA